MRAGRAGLRAVHKVLTQEVHVTGSAGDIFVLGGWANAKSVPNATTTDKGFGFAARYYRMNNTWSEYLMLPMNGGGMSRWLLPAAGAGGV